MSSYLSKQIKLHPCYAPNSFSLLFLLYRSFTNWLASEIQYHMCFTCRTLMLLQQIHQLPSCVLRLLHASFLYLSLFSHLDFIFTRAFTMKFRTYISICLFRFHQFSAGISILKLNSIARIIIVNRFIIISANLFLTAQ